MKDNTYNGHKNWNHWNVSLYLFNDYPLYRIMCDAVENSPTRDKAARFILQQLAWRKISATPDGVPFTFTSIRAAITNWEN